jgi:2-polyprenyl-6-methoxyphenol hydroxylase-like FAD-dependent oxidoreductase
MRDSVITNAVTMATKGVLEIAIVGAVLGGLTAASTLRRVGLDVQVYEQARRFERIGAGTK